MDLYPTDPALLSSMFSNYLGILGEIVSVFTAVKGTKVITTVGPMFGLGYTEAKLDTLKGRFVTLREEVGKHIRDTTAAGVSKATGGCNSAGHRLPEMSLGTLVAMHPSMVLYHDTSKRGEKVRDRVAPISFSREIVHP
jgi:hypothetical protein